MNPDNTYEVQIDGEKVESGELEADWDFLPPKKIKVIILSNVSLNERSCWQFSIFLEIDVRFGKFKSKSTGDAV